MMTSARMGAWAAAFFWVASVMAAEPPACPLKPEFEQKVAECRAASPPDYCAWREFLRALAAGEEHPENQMASRLGLAPEIGARLDLLAVLLLPEAVEPSCLDSLAEAFARKMDGSHPKQGNWDAFLFVLGFENPAFGPLAGDLEDFPAAARPGLVRTARAFAQLLRLLGKEDLAESLILRKPGPDFTTRGRPAAPFPEDPLGPEALHELTGVLDDLSSGRAEVGRNRLAALVRGQDPRFRLRVGFALFSRGVLEEADQVLREVERTVAASAEGDPESRYLAALACWTRAHVLIGLGLDDEAGDLRDKLAAQQDPVVAAMMRWLLEPLPENRRAPSLHANFAAAFEAQRLARANGAAEAFARSYRILFPPGKPLESDLDGPLQLWLTIGSQILDGRLAEAEAEAERLLTLYPHFENLAMLEMVLQANLAQRRPADVLRLARRLVGFIETLLDSYRSDDNLRAFLDRKAQEIFDFAVGAAASIAPGPDAFELAERGRVFSLRRRIGEESRPAPSLLSPAESRLEAQIVHRERSVVRPAALEPLYREFERSRRERLLDAGHVENPAPRLGPSALANLQSTLREDEAILAFYEVAPPPKISGTVRVDWIPPLQRRRLWMWVVTRNSIAQRAADLEDDDGTRLACWNRALRGSASGAADPPEGGRGAEVLAGCSGEGGGADPAEVLHRLLIAPVADLLRPGGRLVVVPHSRLHSIPFAALRDPARGRRLIDDFEILVAPSATVLARLRQLPAPEKEAAP